MSLPNPRSGGRMNDLHGGDGRPAVVQAGSAQAVVADTPFSQPVMLYVGVAGDVDVDMADSGSSIVFKNVPAGTFMPVQVRVVNSAGTTATNLLALHNYKQAV